MAYLTREDGERFVIPSYRDVITTKRKSQLKTEIVALSQNYGEYITFQAKGPGQYEVAFSPDTGYLLGESIWAQFKRPLEMIYCEAIPNTTEAILVIVKNGSVYLDGRFPMESIPEELVIFLTQQNNFEIYIYGDVPISDVPEDGKFSFEQVSVKSFKVLDAPVFPTLPLQKIYQLRLVDQVLRAQGIGVFPLRQVVMGALVLAAIWMLWSYFTSNKPTIEQTGKQQPDPYQPYYAILTSPAPDQEISQFLSAIQMLYTLPGWNVESIKYASGSLVSQVTSGGGKMEDLNAWAKAHNAVVDIKQDGIYLTITLDLTNRSKPKYIYKLKEVMSNFVDKLAEVYPGNHLTLGDMKSQGVYTDMTFTVNFDGLSPTVLNLIGSQMAQFPFVVKAITVKVTNGILTGSINMDAVGT